MAWRLAGRAEDSIDRIVLDSARRWNLETAARYNRLIFAAIAAIGEDHALPGSRPLPALPGVRTLHLRSARHLVGREHRVGQPRHLVLYRVATDTLVEVLDLVHDRQELDRAAWQAWRVASERP